MFLISKCSLRRVFLSHLDLHWQFINKVMHSIWFYIYLYTLSRSFHPCDLCLFFFSPSGVGKVWLLRDATPASSLSTQRPLRQFRSWRDTKPMLSRWVWNVSETLSPITKVKQFEQSFELTNTPSCMYLLFYWNKYVLYSKGKWTFG